MEILRTPEECFDNLPDFPFTPNYVEIANEDHPKLRIHYVEAGPQDAKPVLLMHGEPSWSFLYRKMVPIIATAGHRVIAPDLVGFGRSDKPAHRSDYTYQRHVNWMNSFLQELDLNKITLVCQDWGGLIGLRLATEHQERFARIVVANTGLPTGEQKMSDAFLQWQEFSQKTPVLPVSKIVNGGCTTNLSEEVLAAYDAPFPDESYKEGARIFPILVPTTTRDPASQANKKAWQVLAQWDKPLLTSFSDSDPITKGGDQMFHKVVPGAKGQSHTTILQAGHFLQEDKGEKFAKVVVDFIAQTKH